MHEASGRASLRGVILSSDTLFADSIADEVQSLCTIESVEQEPEQVLLKLAGEHFHTLFIHLQPEDEDAFFGLAEQVRRVYPQLQVFMIGDTGNPRYILRGLRLDVADYLPRETGKRHYLGALKRIAGIEENSRNGFIYSLFSHKGGQGVTSLSINVADQIYQIAGGKVLLLDLNLYLGSIGAALNMVPDFTPYDVLRDFSRIDEDLLFSALYRHNRGFYMLPAPVEVSDADRVSREQLAAMLTMLKKYFTHIVVDLPHDFTERTLAAVEASDCTLLIMEPELLSVKSAQQVLFFFQELNYGENRIRLVLNRKDSTSTLQPEDVETVMQQSLFATINNDRKTMSKAFRKGEVLAVAHENRPVTADIRKMTASLIGVDRKQAPNNTILGFLRKLWP